MRAVFYSKTGGPEVLTYTNEFPKPVIKPKSKQVLVKVQASSMNPVDWKLRNTYRPMFSRYVPGYDIAGIVEDAGSGACFRPGDKVYALIPILSGGGNAEYFLAKDSHLGFIPENLTYHQASVMPLTGLTALQSFIKAGITEENAEENKDKKILIHAGAGGVGSIAIQLAKVYGLTVYSTCSAKNFEYVKSLGCDHPIDYNTEKFEEIATYDYILDLIGGDYELRSMKCIQKTGHYMNVMNSGWASKWSTGKTDGVTGTDSYVGNVVGYMYALYRKLAQPFVGPYYHFTVVYPNGKQLNTLTRLFNEKRIKAINVDKVFKLEDLAEAHKFVQQGHTKGKVVIDIGSSDTITPASKI